MPDFRALSAAALGLAALAFTACAQPAEQSIPAAPPAPPASARTAAPAAWTAPPARIPPDAPPEPRPGPRQPLVIQTASGPVTLQVELADTEAERAQGLMFRRAMGADDGMLFDFHREQSVYFWMKNTYIPLDMLFIRADGSIAAIAENATPWSEAPVGPGVAVQAVLELNAGRAAALGVHSGDRVSHPIFKAR